MAAGGVGQVSDKVRVPGADASAPPRRVGPDATLRRRLGAVAGLVADPGADPVRDRLALLEGQNAVLELIARDAPLALALRRLADLASLLLGQEPVVAWRVDRDRTRLSLEAAAGLDDRQLALIDGAALHPPTLPQTAAMLRREPVAVEDIGADLQWPALRPLAESLGAGALWAVPVLDPGGESLGALGVLPRGPRRLEAAEWAVLDALVPVARVAIETAHRAEALKAANERLASLAANLPGVIYQRVVRPDGSVRYTYVSEGIRELFGVAPHEVIEDPQALFAHHGPHYARTFRENLLKASAELKLWDVEAQIITRDGQEKWTHAMARPRREPDGTVVWDGIILDATRLKRANIELATANRAKSEFLANMSHELRTPLNAIIGFAEVMRDGHLGKIGNPHHAEYIADIHESGKHLLQLINDILDLSKIEAGKLDLYEEEVDVAEVVDGSLRLVKERAEAGRVALAAELAEPLPKVRADERKLKQIVINLLSNAVKFTPEGGKVTVRAGREADGGFALAVADTGIGIAPEDLPRITLPFVQLDGGLNRKSDGTGLGLALCKAMIEHHGGALAIDSAPGQGTTVTIRLPAERVVG